MKRFLASKPFYMALRLIIGLLFAYAGVTKLADPGAFAQAIDGYGLVSWGLAKILAYVLPLLELATGLGLVFDVRGSLGMIVAQLLVFMSVLLYAIHLGLDVDCGCFGDGSSEGSQTGPWEALVRDMLMFGACLVMYWQRWAAGYQPCPRWNATPQ